MTTDLKTAAQNAVNVWNCSIDDAEVAAAMDNLQAAISAVAAEAGQGPEIDYERLVEDAWAKHRYAQGTGKCIAFKFGAEWLRHQLATQPAPPSQGKDATPRTITMALSVQEVRALAEWHDFQQEEADSCGAGTEGDKHRAAFLRANIPAAPTQPPAEGA